MNEIEEIRKIMGLEPQKEYLDEEIGFDFDPRTSTEFWEGLGL
jgi:hypothetical protein